jgi:uncharacterized protein (TIGR03435 family)
MTYKMKPIVWGASVLAWTVSTLFGQAPSAAPNPSKLEFEVASVKEAAPMTGGRMRIGMSVDEGRMTYENVALKDCIRTAYRLKDFQISGPDWMASTRFDIVAKLPEGATKEQVPEMLQALLADRFKLVVHHESKPHDSYALVVGKGGAKLTPSAPDDPASGPAGDTTVKFGGPGGGGGGGRAEGQRMVFSSGGVGGGGGMAVAGGGMGAGSTMKMQLRKLTLTGFAEILGRFLGSPVVDLTEIQGTYDFALEMSLEDITRGSGLMIMKGAAAGGDAGNPAGNSEAADPGGAIFRTVQNYGLKLDKRKAPMDLLVIDHLEKVPTEN